MYAYACLHTGTAGASLPVRNFVLTDARVYPRTRVPLHVRSGPPPLVEPLQFCSDAAARPHARAAGE